MCALKLAAYIFFYRIILVHFSIFEPSQRYWCSFNIHRFLSFKNKKQKKKRNIQNVD